MTLRGRAFAGALVWVTLASAGCADEGEGDPSSSVGTSATEQGAGDEQSDAERREDHEAAEAALLVLDDFPAGWQAEPPEPDDAEGDDAESDDIQAALEECVGSDESEPETDHPSVSSPTFTSPDDETVNAEITLTPGGDDTRRTIEMLERDAAPGCYAEAFAARMERSQQDGGGVPDDVEIGEPTVDRISFDGLGDGSVAFRATIPFSARGTDAAVFFDIVLVRVGRVGIDTTFSSTLTPFDRDESERLTRIVVDRVADADLG